MTVKNWLRALNRGCAHLESTILVLILAALILLANGQIALRNFFGTGILGADSMLRILVLWLALFGAMVATRRREHIAIDLIARLAPAGARGYIARAVNVFCAAVCTLIAYFSITLVQLEFEDGTTVSGLPVWLCQSIIPFSFFVIGWRFLWQALSPASLPPADTQRPC